MSDDDTQDLLEAGELPSIQVCNIKYQLFACYLKHRPIDYLGITRNYRFNVL